MYIDTRTHVKKTRTRDKITNRGWQNRYLLLVPSRVTNGRKIYSIFLDYFRLTPTLSFARLKNIFKSLCKLRK